jgi:hypothetical protein
MKFNIACQHPITEENHLATMEGEVVFSMHGFDWVLHRNEGDTKYWVVSEYKTGHCLPCVNKNKQSIVSLAKRFLEKKGRDATRTVIKEARKINTKLFGEPYLNEPAEELV